MNLDASLNADLHCHSVISDGTLTPEALAERAKAAGVQLWSLTDHDEIGGQARAIAAAKANGLAYLTGTEISVSFAGRVVHIVGLGFDHEAPEMIEGLKATRGGREPRAREMAASLAAAGIPGAFEGALKYVGNPDLISRTHFARFLVDAGHCADVPEVFRRFLTEGKPGFVPHKWAALRDAVGWITRAGGVAVIAHPGRYDFTPTEEYALITEFIAHGGRGIEVVTGSHTPAEFQEYADTAVEFGLLASRGSDFHCPEESRIDLGALPPLAGRLTPVWQALQGRIHHAG
ncbi:3',5'-nucleoside bisphosphate phosphatase [Roseateles sp. DXS20W]|uniref:3',5'-nucleoside bisphosphate phosphatase n=1 Tax=Pelomonas lactea TaxID=3299030 RepID=A0ABW7GLF8_9BURK